MFSLKQWFFMSIPILFLAGSLLHFLYDWSGQNPLVGIFSAVNESIWEHSKLAVLPIISWWTLTYLFLGQNYQLNEDSWFAGAAAALVTAIISIPMLYYFYTQAFGFESVVVDISIFLVAMILGQLLGYHVFLYATNPNALLSIGILFLLVFLFAYLTVTPPKLPIFRDPVNGSFGIQKK